MTGRRLAASAALAVLAGYVDGFAFVTLGGYFVSFMSGNTTQASVELTAGEWGSVGYGAALIAAFVVGGILGTRVAMARGAAGVLALVTAGLLVAATLSIAGLPLAAGPVLALAMAAVNAVLSASGSSPFGITYMTGQLMKLAESIARGERRTWLGHLALWTAIAVGAIAGAAAARWVGPGALWPPIAAAGIAAVTLIVRMRRA